MKLFILSILILTTIFFSCNKSKEELNPDLINAIEGNWEDNGYQDSLRIFIRSDKLVDNNYGITFKSNGKIIENKNSGSCGTPPISYAQFDGTWKSISDNLIEIESTYWGGTMTFYIEFISVSNSELIVYIKY